jgi:hypothetical protein
MTTTAPPLDEVTEPEREPERAPARDLTTIVICVGTGIAASIVYWGIHRALADDGYITLAYAKTLAFHGTWGMVPHHPANSATSPLNVLLLAAGTVVTRRPLLALGLVFVASNVVIAWTTARTARRLDISQLTAVFAVAIILFNPFVLSSTGLESIVIAAMLSALLCCTVEERPAAFGIVAGLALLTRLDLVIFVVPLFLSSRLLLRRWLTVIGITAAVTAPWFVPRWLINGSAIPDTFVIKTLQQQWGTNTFANGTTRFMDWFGAKARTSFAIFLLGGFVILGWIIFTLIRDHRIDRRFLPVIALAVGAGAYFAAYSALGVPPYHWYYCPTIEGASIAVAVTIGVIAQRIGRATHHPNWAALCFLPLAALLVGQMLVIQHHGFPWRKEPIVYFNWAEPGHYKTMAKLLHDRVGDKTVYAGGEIDSFADSRFDVPMIDERIDKAGPVVRWLLKLNYRQLDRDVGPPIAQYRLVWEPGWVADPDTYDVYSSWRGFGHFRLLPG